VHINQEKTNSQIAQLKAEIERLTYELLQYKSKASLNVNISSYSELGDGYDYGFGYSGDINSKSTATAAAAVTMTSVECTPAAQLLGQLRQENVLLLTENENLRQRVKAMQQTIEQQRERYCNLELVCQNLADKSAAETANIAIDRPNLLLRPVNDELLFMNGAGVNGSSDYAELREKQLQPRTILDYLKEIEELRCKLFESEYVCKQLQHKQQQYIQQQQQQQQQQQIRPSSATINNSNNSSAFKPG
jgi:hypothetical protein